MHQPGRRLRWANKMTLSLDYKLRGSSKALYTYYSIYKIGLQVMWPNTFCHRILIFYSTSLSITWSLSTGCSLTQEVPSDFQSALWYLSSYENSIKTAAVILWKFHKNSSNIFPPRQEVMGCMYSHNRINQAVFVIVIYLGLSWVFNIRDVFLLMLLFKTLYLYKLFSGALRTSELQPFWRQIRRYTQVQIWFTRVITWAVFTLTQYCIAVPWKWWKIYLNQQDEVL